MLYLINGAPRAGKDTMAEIIEQILGASHWKFSDALKRAAHGLYQLYRIGDDNLILPPSFFEDRKDEFVGGFMGSTPRQAYIDVHEKLLKPCHGNDVLGKMLVASLADSSELPEHAVISDVGNIEQCYPVLNKWQDDSTVTLIHLDRPGYLWTDNRIRVALPGIRTVYINNLGTSAEEYRKAILDALPELSLASSTSPDGSAGI